MKVNSFDALKYALEDSSCAFITGYSGTIASSFLSKLDNVTQALNETISLNFCHINSYLGNRSISIIKNAGLNEAALSFRNMCDIGINAGLVVIVSDDIDARMSENKQDSRVYSLLGRTLMFEPNSPKQLYEMVKEGFSISEKIGLPVLIRLTNSIADIENEEYISRTLSVLSKNSRAKFDQSKWVLNPLHTEKIFKTHEERYRKILDYVEQSDFNFIIENKVSNGKRLIYSQALNKEEVKKSKTYSKVLSIGTFPIPKNKVFDFVNNSVVDVIDSSEGFLQDEINKNISTNNINKVFSRDVKWRGLPVTKNSKWIDYTKLFKLISKRKPGVIIGDFGSYTMAFDSPIEYSLHYGGSISSAVGAHLVGIENVYVIVGDGGLSCAIEGLIESIRKESQIRIVVIKNKGISKKEDIGIDLLSLAKNNGVTYCEEIKAKDLSEADLLKLEQNNGTSLLIVDFNDEYKNPTEFILNKIKNKFKF